MNRRVWSKVWSTVICGVFLIVAGACTKHSAAPQVIVEIPSGFSGNFVLEMGVKDSPPLEKLGDAYRVPVPSNGRVVTSTLLANPETTFRNASEGSVWGYSHSVFTTGDGIPVGGKIEFFVGTRKEYDAEQNRKNHSGGVSRPADSIATGL